MALAVPHSKSHRALPYLSCTYRDTVSQIRCRFEARNCSCSECSHGVLGAALQPSSLIASFPILSCAQFSLQFAGSRSAAMLAALRGPPTVGHCGQALPCSSPQTSAVPCPCLPHNAATNRRSWKSAQPSRSAGAQRRACRDVSVAALKPFERPSREKVDRRRKDDAPDLPLVRQTRLMLHCRT